MTEVQNVLFSLSDKQYRNFHSKLIPNIDPDIIIGVRVPVLRQYASKIKLSALAAKFLNVLPHKYYEENLLHAFLIEKNDNIDDVLKETERFLPYIDNWAVCDSFYPFVFKKNPKLILKFTKKWIKSSHEYTIRYGVGVLMRMFLDENFDPEILKLVSSIHSDKYYVNMMLAWFFATALAKQYDCTLIYLKEGLLPVWVHNKSIQKAIESKRISKDVKSYLQALKIK